MPDRTETQETIYLIATCANANIGDELITAAWLRHIAAVRPDAEVWLDCPQPGVASHFFGGMHPNLRTTDTLWRVIWEAEGREPEEAAAHVDHRIRNLGSPRYDIGLLGARRATTIHLVGGGHINATWPHHLFLPRAAGLLKELSGATLYGTGLGLMPMSDDPSLFLEDLAAFDHLTVRDRPSAERSGAQLTSDDSFLAVDQVAGFASRAQTRLADSDVWVCLQSDVADPGAFEAAVEATRAFLTDPALAGRTVHYLEGIPGVDRAGFDRLSDLIPEENLRSFLKTWGEGFPARAGQTWITTRYHVHLLAAACGAAGTAIEINDDFYRVKHESLIEAGTGWGLVRAGSKLPEPAGIDPQFRVTASRLHRTKQLEAEKLYPRRAPKAADAVVDEKPARWRLLGR